MDQCGHNAANQVADECKFLTRALNLRLYAICTDFWPSPIHNTTFCSRATGSQKNRKTNLYQKKTGHTTYEIAFRYLQRIHFFGTAAPEITYNMSGGALNSTHSLIQYGYKLSERELQRRTNSQVCL